MDDIDRAKIGKKDEKLVGWDHIRQPMKTNYPPMKAKGVEERWDRLEAFLKSPYKGASKEQRKHGFSWGWFFFIIICVVIVVTKFFRVW